MPLNSYQCLLKKTVITMYAPISCLKFDIVVRTMWFYLCVIKARHFTLARSITECQIGSILSTNLANTTGSVPIFAD
jgi:hypothetical protein